MLKNKQQPNKITLLKVLRVFFLEKEKECKVKQDDIDLVKYIKGLLSDSFQKVHIHVIFTVN